MADPATINGDTLSNELLQALVTGSWEPAAPVDFFSTDEHGSRVLLRYYSNTEYEVLRPNN